MAPARTRGWFAWLAIASGACNQIYGLEPTSLPPPDAPFGCPAIGDTPSFSQIEQHLAQWCESYAIAASAPFASAVCSPLAGEAAIWIASSRDAPLEPAAGAPANGYDNATQIATVYDQVRPAPDGTALYVRRFVVDVKPSPPTLVVSAVEYRRGADGVFAEVGVLPFVTDLNDDLGTLAVIGGDALAIVVRQAARVWVEYRHSQGAWIESTTTTTYDALGVDVAASVSLSADGLRALFVGRRASMSSAEVFYTDRHDTREPFGAARVVSGLPPRPQSILMTPDCEDVHFAGLQSVFRAVRVR